jgi:hypothetical protein
MNTRLPFSKQYNFLGFYMSENTRGLTTEVVGICGVFLNSPCIKHVLEVNQVIINTGLNEW